MRRPPVAGISSSTAHQFEVPDWLLSAFSMVAEPSLPKCKPGAFLPSRSGTLGVNKEHDGITLTLHSCPASLAGYERP